MASRQEKALPTLSPVTLLSLLRQRSALKFSFTFSSPFAILLAEKKMLRDEARVTPSVANSFYILPVLGLE